MFFEEAIRVCLYLKLLCKKCIKYQKCDTRYNTVKQISARA